MKFPNFSFNNRYFNQGLIAFFSFDVIIFFVKMLLEQRHEWKSASLFNDSLSTLAEWCVICMLIVPTFLIIKKTTEKKMENFSKLNKRINATSLPEVLYFSLVFFFYLNAPSFFYSL